jgi:hypothetical protein
MGFPPLKAEKTNRLPLGIREADDFLFCPDSTIAYFPPPEQNLLETGGHRFTHFSRLADICSTLLERCA